MLNFTVKGLAGVLGSVKDTISSIPKRHDAALEMIGFQVSELARRRFKTKKDPYGSSWEGLSSAYNKQKQARKGTEDILVDTGKLRESLGFEIKPLSVHLGAGNNDTTINGFNYADAHQKGTDNIPQRAFYPTSSKKLGKDEVKKVQKIMDNFFDNFF